MTTGTEVCRIFTTAECIAFHIRNALGTVAGANLKDIHVALNIAHNKLLDVKALVAEILQTSVTTVRSDASERSVLFHISFIA